MPWTLNTLILVSVTLWWRNHESANHDIKASNSRGSNICCIRPPNSARLFTSCWDTANFTKFDGVRQSSEKKNRTGSNHIEHHCAKSLAPQNNMAGYRNSVGKTPITVDKDLGEEVTILWALITSFIALAHCTHPSSSSDHSANSAHFLLTFLLFVFPYSFTRV